MKKHIIISLLIILPVMNYSQNKVTIHVEDLKKPEKGLRLSSYNNLYNQLILSDVDLNLYEIKKENIDFPFNVISKSKAPDSLVTYQYNSFINGMYHAYADHRPFVLSPDMIWLLISQGFAQHVNNNSEELRKLFTQQDGKVSLIVRNDNIQLDNPNSPWESIFPEFTKQIGTFTGEELMKVLTSDFTTTTPTSKVASEITIMEAMKSYFEYIVLSSSCGIPEITLEGTPEDWQKIVNKATYLKKYKLDWWINEIEPILKEFVKTSKGEIDNKFWMNMYKCHSQTEYGAPDIIDGWVVKFFPYDKFGKRNKLNNLSGFDNLPKEIVKVDLEYINIVGDSAIKTPLELWAGFIGLEQNSETYALKPQIGWMIRKKDINNKALTDKFKSVMSCSFENRIDIRVQKVPKEVLNLEKIRELNIDFIDKIEIPDEMSKMKIDYLRISGKISKFKILRICRLLPNTKLMINGKRYNGW